LTQNSKTNSQARRTLEELPGVKSIFNNPSSESVFNNVASSTSTFHVYDSTKLISQKKKRQTSMQFLSDKWEKEEDAKSKMNQFKPAPVQIQIA